MPDAIDFRRLRYTPLRDALRGRVTGSLDWRVRLAAADLPASVMTLIATVVRRARLWHVEASETADELIAHFADGLASGATADDLVREFGDPRVAAKLIRRAKIRHRPWFWHALKYPTRAALGLFAIYGVLLLRFVTAEPTVRIDTVSLLNAPTLRVAEADRAWPVYRRAIEMNPLGITQADPVLDAPIARQDATAQTNTLSDANASDPEWPRVGAWLDGRATQIALFRQAAARPVAGITYQLDEPWSQIELHGRGDATSEPNINGFGGIANALTRDLNWAISQHDGARSAEDVIALLGLADQERAGPLWMQQVALGTDRNALRGLRDALTTSAAMFSDAQLVALAHRVGHVGDATASTFFDLNSTALIAHDAVQRSYTDDGHGDGRPSATAVRGL